jgi:hypothetical protein
MSDHREKDKEYKKHRGLSRRAHLRKLEKAFRLQQMEKDALLVSLGRFQSLVKALQRRLEETQKLLPFWVRKVP